MKKWILNIVALLAIWGPLALTAHAQATGTTAGFALTTASTQVLAPNGNQRGFLIQNSPLSASAIYCACGVAANSSSSPPVGHYIIVGGNWESPYLAGACQAGINCAAVSTATCEATSY
jgi:hypothetical protein